MPRDVNVGRADLVPGRQIRKCQWHLIVVRHERQNTGIKAAHGVTQKPTQMRLAPAVVHDSACACAGLRMLLITVIDWHFEIVKQTD